ncbi:3-oxoacyl-ACP reductase FabG [Ketobacter alkanivorans]|uniref:3-oxoacyl-[acyl-carrier-protein] reductase n=1 Tax=Ketobacter alkanivorans TaxID=1917421 RepID=A0A2K9LQJ4_9GAMM|nr:3-oxoacyl-ACP reductase FabG [Ketobacter alkanivorans]AUM14629.1 3-oxoacyl-ACP reductase [Ketobacter alkanivorans]MCP5013899.1 3-oxoacyl-ACP reductase FabG [Ketobacter sp.]
MSLEGKVALVTGASRGIGRAIAESLIARGAVVLGTATSESGAENITNYIKEAGGNGRGFCLNVTDPANIDVVMNEIQKEYGVPQVLVNNAGITRDNLMLRMKEEEWDQVIDTNLTSVYRMSKACLRGMTKARWGRIINISSVVGLMGNMGQANYSAAKAGLEGFTRSLAKEIGSRGITVNSVAPGFIDTDMTKELPAASKEAMLAQIPAGRLGQPQEIAAVVSFLAGEESGYITGATIPVNGGMYM